MSDRRKTPRKQNPAKISTRVSNAVFSEGQPSLCLNIRWADLAGVRGAEEALKNNVVHSVDSVM